MVVVLALVSGIDYFRRFWREVGPGPGRPRGGRRAEARAAGNAKGPAEAGPFVAERPSATAAPTRSPFMMASRL